MATKIRLQRRGHKDYAFYSIVIADARAPRDGKFIEKIGTYNPNTNPATVDLNFERAMYWVGVGAQPTDTARNILSREGVYMMKHLQGGVKKGAFDEATAQARFEAWKSNKQANLAAIVSKNGGADEVGTYTTAHGTTTVTVGAAAYTLAFNGKFQLVATTDAETLVLDRVVSDPEPEQFLPIFGGVYTCNMFSMQFEAVLYQSDKYPENFIISPYMYSQKPMYFTMNADGSLVVEKQETGLYYDANEGKIYGQEVPGCYQIYVSDGVTYSGKASPLSAYDQSKGVFNFALIWHIDQGYFNEAPEVDTFQLTEELSNKKEPSFMKVQKLDKPFNFDKKLPLFKK